MRRRLALLPLLLLGLWLLLGGPARERALTLHLGRAASQVRELDLHFQRGEDHVRHLSLQFPAGAPTQVERSLHLREGDHTVAARVRYADGREARFSLPLEAEQTRLELER